ncbi:MAG: glycosyltransferase [Nitrospira sp.]
MAARTIVHIITRLDRGGSAQNTMLTVLGHDRTEFEPVVVAGDPGRWDAQGGMAATEEHRRRLEEKGIRLVLLPSLVRPISLWNDLRALWALVGLLRALRPAIVHTHTSKAGVLGRLAAWIARVPTVVHTPHGHVFYGHFGPWKSRVFLTIERMLAPLTTTLIALTGSERADHLERGVGVPERFTVIPSGIDVTRFHRARVDGRRIPEWFGCPDDALVIGSIGWLTDIKGHRVLIDALGLLHREFPRAHVVVVGSGDQYDALRTQAERLGLRERVHLVGHREQVEACLAGMDCFVLPSLNEGMGRALIEAMAAGLPVVASRVGGIPAIVEHDVNGLLVEAGDSRALADAICRILSRPEWAEMLGRRAAQRIGEEFGARSMVLAIEQVYRDATQSPPRPSTLAQGLARTVLALSVLGAVSPADAASRMPLRVALHVHSTASTGTLSLEELATRAEQRGLDALVLSDNFTLDYEYGLWPFRSLIRKTVSYPSVLAYGLDKYLAEVEVVQARHPRLVIVPGVEVAPFYYWTGSLMSGDLTMHDAQRNLLVVGLTRADDYRALPARGNPDSFRKDRRMWQWAPLLLMVPAVALWNPFRRTSRGWHEPVGPFRRATAGLCAILAVTPLVQARPFGTPVFSSYDAQQGYRPYQALIDAAVERGAVVLWSMTEAHDFRAHTFGPLGTVTVRTDPAPGGVGLDDRPYRLRWRVSGLRELSRSSGASGTVRFLQALPDPGERDRLWSVRLRFTVLRIRGKIWIGSSRWST